MNYRPTERKRRSLVDSITSFMTAVALVGIALVTGFLAPKLALALVIIGCFLCIWWALRELS